MRWCVAHIAIVCCVVQTSGQSFGTRALRSRQPMQFLVGADPQVLTMQLSTAGDVQLPLRLGVGSGVGAAFNERVRIASIDSENGNGLVVDMIGTQASNGIVVKNIGMSGTEHAGIVIQSASNGSGTGLRLGGPPDAQRPTLGTGIDITGGTGIRYNALSAGTATALDIGGTVPPSRGINVTTSGSDNVGGFFRTNMLGAALIGSSQSSAYADPPLRVRVGVRGHAASNSAAAADDIVGVLGTVTRGGNGGSQTQSMAVKAIAEATATAQAGLVEALHGEVTTSATGNYGAIAAHLVAPSLPNSFGLVVSGGASVILGCSDDERPPGLSTTMMNALGVANTSTTYMHHARASGGMSTRTFSMRGSTLPDLAAGMHNDVDIGTYSVIRVWSTAPGSAITGFSGGADGKVLLVVNRGAPLTLVHEGIGSQPFNRITSMTGDDVTTMNDGTFLLWYDASLQRWIIVAQQL
jgi:hypothetical protein